MDVTGLRGPAPELVDETAEEAIDGVDGFRASVERRCQPRCAICQGRVG